MSRAEESVFRNPEKTAGVFLPASPLSLSDNELLRALRVAPEKQASLFLVSMPVDAKAFAAQVAADYGVSTESDESGKQVFFLQMDGKKLPVDLDATKPLETQLNKLVADRVREIEKRFGVEVAAAGEIIADPYFDPRTDWRGKGAPKSTTRKPRLDELMAIELSMKSCEPSQVPGKDDKPLMLYFFDKTFSGATTVAQYDPSFKGRPAVLIFGNNTAGRAIEEPTKKDSPDVVSLHRIVVHELAHHAQFKTGWKVNKVPDDALEALGWTKKKDAGWNDRDFLLLDKDGNKYAFVQNAILVIDHDFVQISNPTWVKTDDAGGYLKGKERVFLTPEQMAKIAKVRPVSTYFPNPAEMYAESLTAFRLNEAWRERLLKANESCYQFIKKQDQREIDAVFGKDKKIRATSGNLVDDTPEAQKAVTDFESAARKLGK